MDRFWFLTWHTYGTWLPGSEPGFVGEIRDEEGKKVIHNEPGTPCDANMPGLRHYAKKIMKGTPIYLTKSQAESLFNQLQETAQFRKWTLLGVSISPTHVHLLVGVPGDPDPEKILGDFKAWGTRVLNKGWGQTSSETWWTQGGSKRKKQGAEALRETVQYIRNQQDTWVIWIKDDFNPELF